MESGEYPAALLRSERSERWVATFRLDSLFTVILFFPAFYYIIELIDIETPDSEALLEDEKESAQQSSVGSVGGPSIDSSSQPRF